MPTSRRLRRTVHGLAVTTVTTAAALVLPVSAAPTAAATPLTQAIETLQADAVQTNGSPDEAALTAAKSIARATASASDAAEPSDLLGAYQSSVDLLRGLGIEPFMYPTGSPYCTDTGAFPLGITPAVAGAVPGSWPNRTFLGYPINVVNPGETLFAFVPFGIDGDGIDTASGNTTGMQVAWFNASTLQGGFAPMGTIGEAAKSTIPKGLPDVLRPGAEQLVDAFFTNAIHAGGVRAAPVETGSGTVLAAVFGTVHNGEKSCFFFPTVGITEVG